MTSSASSLAGKTLFITGASRGIGLAIALRAAKDGANIVVAAKTSEPHPKLPGTIHSAAADVEAAGGKALPVVCDVRSDEQIRAAVDAALAASQAERSSVLAQQGCRRPRRHRRQAAPVRGCGRLSLQNRASA